MRLITSIIRKILYYGFCNRRSVWLSFEHMSLKVAFNEFHRPLYSIFTFPQKCRRILRYNRLPYISFCGIGLNLPVIYKPFGIPLSPRARGMAQIVDRSVQGSWPSKSCRKRMPTSFQLTWQFAARLRGYRLGTFASDSQQLIP